LFYLSYNTITLYSIVAVFVGAAEETKMFSLPKEGSRTLEGSYSTSKIRTLATFAVFHNGVWILN